MPIFDDPVPPHLLWPETARWPRRRIAALIARFEKTFPDILYESRPSVPAANAQALRLNGRHCVVIYGGLTRHRCIGWAGLAVALAHETGHHLGGPPHLEHFRWLSSEERANDWARDVGLPAVFATRAIRVWQEGSRDLRSAFG
ncbi:MAG: hypothetical protein JSR90_00610 [Proteobacteria bacterium]|nr:hypothetical protein [Pseudomonadota bacterium]